MLHVIECAGHPRDMGSLQGQTCCSAVVEALARAGLPHRRGRLPVLSAFASGSVRGRGVGREIIRHYTHLSERIDGLARGAGVPTDSLIELHARTLAAGPGTEWLYRPAVALLASGLDGQPGPSLVRALPAAEPLEPGFILRRSEPEVGFRSLDVTLPWLATAVAGVNANGLAVAFLPEPAAESLAGGAPAFVLLVQECLQRFEQTRAAADWCLGRPASGSGSIVIVDAMGELAHVAAIGASRRLVPHDGLPLALGHPARLVESLVETARHEAMLDAKAMATGGGAAPPEAFVRLVCAEQRIQLKRLAPPLEEALLEL